MSGDYMDHWVEQAPAPITDKKFEVRLRVVGGAGYITVTVLATAWPEAHEKAMAYVRGNLRVHSCL